MGPGGVFLWKKTEDKKYHASVPLKDIYIYIYNYA
jgi:hypothetical protein